MTVTYAKPVQVDEVVWRLGFTSDAATPVPFRVFVGGVLAQELSSPDGAGEVFLTIAVGDFPYVEVLDDDDLTPAIAFPGRFDVHWPAVAGAAQYRVEEYVASTWTLRDLVPDDGSAAYTWRSRWLEDDTAHYFRVIPVDSASNEGSVIAFSGLMVRHPDPPEVTYTYDGAIAETVTIAAA